MVYRAPLFQGPDEIKTVPYKIVPGPNDVTAQRFNVQSIPALLLLKDGREIDRIVSVHPKPAILRRVERAITRNAALLPER
jgi:hypothetical protein